MSRRRLRLGPRLGRLHQHAGPFLWVSPVLLLPRRPTVGDVVAFGSFLLRGLGRAGARSPQTRRLLGAMSRPPPPPISAQGIREESSLLEPL